MQGNSILYAFLQVDFELRVLFRVVAEDKRLRRLDRIAQPSTEVVVVDVILCL